ncbi:MAG: metallophosphoesterase [Myxococcota bacterium]|nr:metallophosphoesterase [Myxococcota bacterium]
MPAASPNPPKRRLNPRQRRRLAVSGLVLSAGLAGALVFPGCKREGRAPESRQPPVQSDPGAATSTPLARAADPAAAPSCEPPAPLPTTRFAVIGDFGYAGLNEQRVADFVKGQKPEFVLTTGDNNYVYGEQKTIDANIGQYYAEYICPYSGRFGPGARVNRFFPALGNHDWSTRSLPYLDYFQLPGNERYYDVVWGNVHVFVLDSDQREPDGISADSKQAAWLRQRLAASKSRWKVVTLHHPPYSSGSHGSSLALRWPYEAWGASLVLAGHDHHYERVEVGKVPFIVNGLGGRSLYAIDAPIPGSVVRFAAAYGAQIIEATPTELVSRFFTTDGKLIDERKLSD